MGLKICEKCGEKVDEAKAFCPDCGNPFVEEKQREESSEFDKYAGTVNFSQSVFKMMLSEMDLDTSKSTDKEKKPDAVEGSEKLELPLEKKITIDIQQKQERTKTKQSQTVLPKATKTEQVGQSNSKFWLIFSGISGIIFFFLTSIVLLVAFYLYFYQG